MPSTLFATVVTEHLKHQIQRQCHYQSLPCSSSFLFYGLDVGVANNYSLGPLSENEDRSDLNTACRSCSVWFSVSHIRKQLNTHTQYNTVSINFNLWILTTLHLDIHFKNVVYLINAQECIFRLKRQMSDIIWRDIGPLHLHWTSASLMSNSTLSHSFTLDIILIDIELYITQRWWASIRLY